MEATALDVLREPRIEQQRPLGKRDVHLSVLDASWVLAGQGPCPFLTSQKRCSIYLTRPNTCVGFLAGSPKCNELRTEYGLPKLPSGPKIQGILGEIMRVAIAPEMDEPS